jgi:protein-tyrosine-phosphatase
MRARLAEQGLHAHVVGAGFHRAGMPPMSEAINALATQGHDVRGYKSRTVDEPTAVGADLIITAERGHVVRLCGDHIGLFARTFTLPELVLRAEAIGPRRGSDFDGWLAKVGAGRTPAEFLHHAPPEIADPTGLAESAVAAAMVDIGEWCRRLAVLL